MWLIKTSDDAQTRFTFRIAAGSIKTIGRATRADFIVKAPLVSRLHCRITAGSAELEVADLHSTNGTYVNGRRVTRAHVREGDRLRVGRVEFVVNRADSSPEA